MIFAPLLEKLYHTSYEISILSRSSSIVFLGFLAVGVCKKGEDAESYIFASILVESTLFLFVLFAFCGVCANIDLSTRTNEP
jgi:hypothetical protein